MFPPFQEDHRESKLTLRPPSLAAPYAPVQNWQHQPEKLIFESCGYEANVSGFLPMGWRGRGGSGARPGCRAGQFPAWGLERLSLSQQYLGSMLIKDLRGTESTQDACAKMRVRRPQGRGIRSQPVMGGGE